MASEQWAGRDSCNTCNLSSVVWRRAGRGKFFVHEDGVRGCRFPCRNHHCGHLDCEVYRCEVEEPKNEQPKKKKDSNNMSKATKRTKLKTKICTHCERRRSASAFRADNTKPSGLMSWCKDCLGVWSKKYRARLKREAG